MLIQLMNTWKNALYTINPFFTQTFIMAVEHKHFLSPFVFPCSLDSINTEWGTFKWSQLNFSFCGLHSLYFMRHNCKNLRQRQGLLEKGITWKTNILNQSYLIIDKIITNDTEMPVLLPTLVIQNQPSIIITGNFQRFLLIS